jgi:septum formation protein
VEEHVSASEPWRVVEELSGQKAEAVLEGMPGEDGVLVIGADTVVAADGSILGKPKGAEDAARMLRMLSGREHTVYTGVTLLLQKGERETIKKSFHEATKVIFYPMTEEEIEAYVATKDPLDKAGAYGIQGLCARYIRGIEGDYNNVVGLPVGRLYQEIKGLLL